MGVYFPVLRWKQGERAALSALNPATKDQVEPIIEFPDCDYENNKFTEFVTTATRDWGIHRPFFVDFSGVDFEGSPTGSGHPVLTLLREAHQQQLAVIPVFKLDMDPDLFEALQLAYDEGYYRNLALRITDDEEDTAANDAADMLDDIGVTPAQVDLIVDLQDVSNGAMRSKIRSLNTLLSQFGRQYLRVIILSGAIPGDLSNRVGTDNSARLPRYDWRLWLQIHHTPNLAYLFFGDYTTTPCEFKEVPFQGAPKIRYTLDDEWYVIKGHKSRQRDNQRQNQALAIVSSSFFHGQYYSYGDTKIYECSIGSWGPGNPTNWVTNDISQHITFVVSQVSAILAAP